MLFHFLNLYYVKNQKRELKVSQSPQVEELLSYKLQHLVFVSNGLVEKSDITMRSLCSFR